MDGVHLPKIEQLLQERFAPPSSIPVALILVIIPALLKGDATLIRGPVDGSRGRAVRTRALEEFVELSPIQPDAATVGAIVDFDALALGHVQVDLTDWALHRCIPFAEPWARDQIIWGRRVMRHGCPVVVRWSRPGSCATVTTVRHTGQEGGAA
jgi:hypothetical protein